VQRLSLIWRAIALSFKRSKPLTTYAPPPLMAGQLGMAFYC
jgi:hypothetical protein